MKSSETRLNEKNGLGTHWFQVTHIPCSALKLRSCVYIPRLMLFLVVD